MIASALSGCAGYAVTKALGPNPQLYPPVVEAYEWAGRRGDELVVVYRVWGGHPRRHETRWTAIDLRSATWGTGLVATSEVGELGDRVDPVPNRESLEPVRLIDLRDAVGAQELRAGVGVEAVAVLARHGATPELIVVARDETGQLRSASWALRPAEDPARAESVPRQLARGAAGAVDLGTAPVQILLFMLGVVRVH